MPDLKFWDPGTAKELANAEDYREVACRAVKEMHRQVSDLVLDDRGLIRRGLLIRHLVMPDALEETRQILHFIAREISPNTYVNVMPQYRPAGCATRYDSINRPLTAAEYARALEIAEEEGLRRLDER